MNRPEEPIASEWTSVACSLGNDTAGTHAVAPSGF